MAFYISHLQWKDNKTAKMSLKHNNCCLFEGSWLIRKTDWWLSSSEKLWKQNEWIHNIFIQPVCPKACKQHSKVNTCNMYSNPWQVPILNPFEEDLQSPNIKVNGQVNSGQMEQGLEQNYCNLLHKIKQIQ